MELVIKPCDQERIIDLEDPKESKDIIMLLAVDRIGDGRGFHGVSQRIWPSQRSLWNDHVLGYGGHDCRGM